MLLGLTLKETGESAMLIVHLVSMAQQVLRNNDPMPKFARELDSILPKIQE
jgi:hypothetical protein